MMNGKTIIQNHSGSGDNVAGDKYSVERPELISLLTEKWFEDQVNGAINNLGRRFSPELNIEIDTNKYFDAIERNEDFRKSCRDEVARFVGCIEYVLKTFSKHFTQDEISTIESALKEIIAKCYSFINSADSDFEDKVVFDEIILIQGILSGYAEALREPSLEKILANLFDFKKFLDGNYFKVACKPILLIVGNGGIGKSHLLANALNSRLKQHKKSVFILGQHLKGSTPPWKQILENASMEEYLDDDFLEALNEKGKELNERVLIAVDAMNEGQGKVIWPDHFAGVVQKISTYPWLAFVATLRSSYESLFDVAHVIRRNGLIRVNHSGFSGREERAARVYFQHYGINFPRVPLLAPEFSNPLYLKLFCESLVSEGLSEIPDNFRGFSAVVKSLVDSTDKKLSGGDSYDYPQSKKLARKAIYGIVARMSSENVREIHYDEAYEIAEKVVRRFSDKRHFIEALIDEGVFSKDIRGEDEFVFITYERLADYIEADYLIGEFKPSEWSSISEFLGHNYQDVFENPFMKQGVLEALAILLPEKLNVELIDLFSSEDGVPSHIVEACLQSLIWRKNTTITDSMKAFVRHSLESGDNRESLFSILFYLLSEPDHPFNATLLHDYLVKFTMADRDSFWVPFLQRASKEYSSVRRVISWKNSSSNEVGVSQNSRLNLAIGLSWIFASTHIELRDSATMSLSTLLEDNLVTAVNLLKKFEQVNDPYIYERILAACYGAVLRSEDRASLSSLCKILVSNIFDQDEVYPNCHVRNYARGIIEFACHYGDFSLEDMKMVRPPYNASLPDSYPDNDEIDSYRYDYKADDFKEIYWGQNSILSSMVTEYGRETSMYGDFGRYTFESAFYDWKGEKLDTNGLSNYACWLIFNEYGYDPVKHGAYDRYASAGDRHTNRIERIGKKYQWIALYELISRVADNIPMNEPSDWPNFEKEVWYQGPWQNHLQNIDPTTLVPEIKSGNPEAKKFVLEDKLANWNGEDAVWLADTNGLPDPKFFIDFDELVVLEDHDTWDEVNLDYELSKDARKQFWYQIRSYLVSSSEFDAVYDYVSQKDLMGRWMPKTPEVFNIYGHEFCWSPAYKDIQKSYYGFGWETPRNAESEKIGKILPTTTEYAWEGGATECPRFYVPTDLMFNGLRLKPVRNVGEWVNDTGAKVCFNLSMLEKGLSGVVLKKSALHDFLVENDLKIFWTFLGQKMVLPSDHWDFRDDSLPPLNVSGCYTFIDGEIQGKIATFQR
ncbi:NACHT domain-containing protein [Maridesulfovibrio hydrothermalis]|uniref:ATP-binding protein n=1 Tax=Maridesulfovibrio hydrothermalis AM13 = DSM 14728 TaxID=1121451 RepID=L0RCW1_9BACT|nr:ATP-binding protein [Maridesulfovibrio hydrothermalis]CCO24057.1 conserved protein of unknown function [Maridesulfovibrio hydrothermalis AM13 = DSM 14728]